MLDPLIRRAIDPTVDAVGRFLQRTGISANAITVLGAAVGLLAVPALAVQAYGWALAAIVANRILDGLDGAVARAAGPTDLGGFLDIVADFLFYSAVPLGFALGRPDMALPALVLVFSFVGTGSSFLAYAVIAARRGVETTSRGRGKALYYLGGLTEGFETILVLVAMCIFPDAFAWIAYGFAAACALTTATRVMQAMRDFG